MKKHSVVSHTQFDRITRLHYELMIHKIWLQYLRYTCRCSTCRQARANRRIIRKLIKALSTQVKLGNDRATLNVENSDMRLISSDSLQVIVTELNRLKGVRVEGWVEGFGPRLHIKISKLN